MSMDIIRIFLKHPRRYIPDINKKIPKTRKYQINIVKKFLFYLKKELKIKNFNQITEFELNKYIEVIKQKGIWNNKNKRFEKISERTLKNHISILKQFLKRIKIQSGA